MIRCSLFFLSLSLVVVFQPVPSSAKEEVSAAEESSTPQGLSDEEFVFNFGHVGGNFKVHHAFPLVNRTQKPIKVTGIDVPCDCSAATARDSIIQPDDTGYFQLTFSTKDDFGPTSRSFIVFTDHEEMPEVEFTYKSTIGQWLDGIKPYPISLFFLPAQKAKKVTIFNTAYDEIILTAHQQYDTTFEVIVLRGKAAQREALELEIAPRASLREGTYGSNVTLVIEKKGRINPSIISIPIKIVRY